MERYNNLGENYTFNLREELIKYCRKDVNTFRMAYLSSMNSLMMKQR